VPLDARELRVVIVNSIVKHELSSGEYCRAAKAVRGGCGLFSQAESGLRARADVTMSMVEDAKGIWVMWCGGAVGMW